MQCMASRSRLRLYFGLYFTLPTSCFLLRIPTGVGYAMRVRTQLVAYIRKHMGAFGACTVVYTTNTPQGYHIHTYGNTRLQCVDLDGLQVMTQRRNNGQFDPPEHELLDAMAGTPD